MTDTNDRNAVERLALARQLDARLRELVRRSNRTEALIAGLLYTISEQGLELALGFKNLNAYAHKVAGWGTSKTSRIVTLVGQLRHLPEMRRAFFTGKLPWTNACLAAAAAIDRPETDAHWTERAKTLSREDLEQEKRFAANEPALYRLPLELTPDQRAYIDAACVALQRERGEPVDRATVVAEACRRMVLPGMGDAVQSGAVQSGAVQSGAVLSGAVQAGPARGGALVDAGPRPLVVLGVCVGCETVTHGTEKITLAEAGPALCHAQIVDFTVEPPARRPTIGPRVVAQVLARDQGQCRVPGCTNRAWLELHHEGGWRKVGHDPDSIICLCTRHHKARHEGLLKIAFDSGRVTFALADGEILGEVDLRVLRSPRVNPAKKVFPGKHVAQEAAHETVSANVRSDAKKGLVALGFRVADAERALDAAGSWPAAGTLIKEALKLMPSRAEVAAPALEVRSESPASAASARSTSG